MNAVHEDRGVVGYVPGAWDMFHIGHLNILKRAREYCDWLVAGVVTDDALFTMKNKYPIIPFEERLAIVEAIGIVDQAIVDHSANKVEVWQNVHFDLLFKGDDWRGTPKGKRLECELATVGARVQYFPYTLHTSSTELRRVLAEW
jgi:glycerol-3-phosphate cytidylyltransferase